MKIDMEKSDLIDGSAIISSSFAIITANEALYRFMGSNACNSITDIIHQIDVDDFIDVVNSLRLNLEKAMVIRMKRFDNSYRWMLTKVKKCSKILPSGELNEYIEVNVSDIIALEKQRLTFRDLVSNTYKIMSLEGEIYYRYDCNTKIISFSSFIDNILVEMSECPVDAWLLALSSSEDTDSDASFELITLQNEFINCNPEFFHIISSKYFSSEKKSEELEIKGVTTYENSVPSSIVGSIRNIDFHGLGYTKHTYEHSRHHELLSFDEIKSYISKNIAINSRSEFSILLVQIDDLMINDNTFEDSDKRLYSTAINTAKELVGYRGIVGEYKKGILYIVIRKVTSEMHIRAFIETLRSQISWNYKSIDSDRRITFSIGISRRPENGSDYDILIKKAVIALDMANDKGHDRYIIYVDKIHGRI